MIYFVANLLFRISDRKDTELFGNIEWYCKKVANLFAFITYSSYICAIIPNKSILLT